jgi:hypothetical protein
MPVGNRHAFLFIMRSRSAFIYFAGPRSCQDEESHRDNKAMSRSRAESFLCRKTKINLAHLVILFLIDFLAQA